MNLEEMKNRLENIKSRVKESNNKEKENNIEWEKLYKQRVNLCKNLDSILGNIAKTEEIRNYINKSK